MKIVRPNRSTPSATTKTKTTTIFFSRAIKTTKKKTKTALPTKIQQNIQPNKI
jgi:hypothetical protein